MTLYLKQLRVDLGLSPEALAPLADVGGGTIRRIESGKGAQAATLGKLADALTAKLRESDEEALAVKPSELLREVPVDAAPSERSAAA